MSNERKSPDEACAHCSPSSSAVHLNSIDGATARQSADLQSRAMADAARVAFGAEVGAALQRLKSLHERPERRWERWLTHAAAAATASAGTLMLTLTLWAR